MMWTLIKKDLRLNLLLIGSAALFSAMPYALAAVNLVVNPPDHKVVETRDYVQTLEGAGYACLILMVIMSSAFGGSSFALERRDRSAEFLGMLPVSRRRIGASKLLGETRRFLQFTSFRCRCSMRGLDRSAFVAGTTWSTSRCRFAWRSRIRCCCSALDGRCPSACRARPSLRRSR